MSSLAPEPAGRELFVRHAKRDGRSVTVLRAVDYGNACVVEAEVFPIGSTDTVHPGPYTFADAAQATALRHRGRREPHVPRLRRLRRIAGGASALLRNADGLGTRDVAAVALRGERGRPSADESAVDQERIWTGCLPRRGRARPPAGRTRSLAST